MTEVIRVKVKRIYVGKAVLTGLAFGIFIGLLFSIILMISSSLGAGNAVVLGKQVDFLKPSFAIVIALFLIVISSVLTTIIALLWALFYNLIAKIGFNMDLGLLEIEQNASSELTTPGNLT